MLRISFSNLPPRPRALSHGELSKIYGGCSTQGIACSAEKGCCPGLSCDGSSCIESESGAALGME
jgi:hypothetical protein